MERQRNYSKKVQLFLSENAPRPRTFSLLEIERICKKAGLEFVKHDDGGQVWWSLRIRKGTLVEQSKFTRAEKLELVWEEELGIGCVTFVCFLGKGLALPTEIEKRFLAAAGVTSIVRIPIPDSIVKLPIPPWANTGGLIPPFFCFRDEVGIIAEKYLQAIEELKA